MVHGQGDRNARFRAQRSGWPYTSQGVQILTVPGQAPSKKKMGVSASKTTRLSARTRVGEVTSCVVMKGPRVFGLRSLASSCAEIKPPGSNTKREAFGVYCPSRSRCAEILHVLGVPVWLLPRSSFLL